MQSLRKSIRSFLCEIRCYHRTSRFDLRDHSLSLYTKIAKGILFLTRQEKNQKKRVKGNSLAVSLNDPFALSPTFYLCQGNEERERSYLLVSSLVSRFFLSGTFVEHPALGGSKCRALYSTTIRLEPRFRFSNQ